jgi:threonine synthase
MSTLKSSNHDPLGSLPPELVSAASDRQADLADRLEAYEDLVDSEIGDTTLVRARHLERESGLRHLFLKFEGSNPSGTQKDRIAFAQANDALRRGFDAVTVATCGNYGAATALAARAAGLDCHIFIPQGYHTTRSSEMEENKATLHRVPGDYEAAVEASREFAEAKEVYDANPGGANVALQLKAYGEIAWEIYDQLRDAPAVVAVPCSNGTTLAGIYRGFLSLYRRGKTSHIPHMVAGSSAGKNPIVRAFRKGLESCEDLPPESIRESAVNEPLINWHSIDGDPALQALRATEGWAADVSDRAMTTLARRLAQEDGHFVLPAATAGLIALLQQHEASPLPPSRYVAVLTGRKR